jgi:hypothetical protein
VKNKYKSINLSPLHHIATDKNTIIDLYPVQYQGRVMN